MGMIAHCQTLADGPQPLKGTTTSGCSGDEDAHHGGVEKAPTESSSKEHQQWRRRRRRKEEKTMIESRQESEMIKKRRKEETKKKIERTLTTISDQTLALRIENSHYGGDNELSISWRRLFMFRATPAGREHNRKSGWWLEIGQGRGRRDGGGFNFVGNKFGSALLFTLTLMILTTITLSNTFDTTIATTMTMELANFSNDHHSDLVDSRGYPITSVTAAPTTAIANAANPVNRTIDDKTNDADCYHHHYHHHHVQSMLQNQAQQQIPFKTQLTRRAPRNDENQSDKEITNSSKTMLVDGLVRKLRTPANNFNSNKVAHHLLAQQAQSQQQLQQFLQQLRVSETDILPFSDFSVQQPAFSDIIKSWPPTTRLKQQQQHNDNDNYIIGSHQRLDSKRQRAQFGQHRLSDSGHYAHQSSAFGGALDNLGGQWQIRNHLNEDYDDTIVTADESFEQDQLPEPPTWVNYLGELGELIYAQLSQLTEEQQQQSTSGKFSAARQQRLEIIENLLDDFYYDQYENSQVLYYGPQLVHQGDIFEIGCYLPNEQPAEWTKSGRSLVEAANGADGEGRPAGRTRGTTATAIINPLRVVKRGDFMGAKQNYSLKVFEAQMSDSGNYRCNRLSRKYHKLIVVPQKISLNQQYLYQQRLLSVVGSTLSQQQRGKQQKMMPAAIHQPVLSQQQVQLATLYQTNALLKQASGQQQQASGRGRSQSSLTIQASGSSGESAAEIRAAQMSRQNASFSSSASRTTWPVSASGKFPTGSGQYLMPSHLIQEHQPLSVQCHISDELILRKLREMPQFHLAWYKNGKLLRNSQLASSIGGSGRSPPQQSAGRQLPAALLSQQQQQQQQSRLSSQRIQFVGPNGRQMYIGSANYADAGDYMCSWAKLNEMLRQAAEEPSSSGGDDSQSDLSLADYSSSSPGAAATTSQLPVNPTSGASHHQLVAPVKLRPFKSAYYVRAGNQLRLICQVQRGYPSAFISWYVGNQLVDADYLREHQNELRVLQLQAPNRLSGSSVTASASNDTNNQGEEASQYGDGSQQQQREDSVAQIVEINPIPAGRQQMQLTTNGRGQWIEYRELTNEKYSIDSPDKQLRYLQMKLAQLTGTNGSMIQLSSTSGGGDSPVLATFGGGASQASLSVLVVNRLQTDKHTSRYACRATGRANTDEVTTVIRVKDSTTIVIQPINKAATLIPGQPLHFECGRIEKRKAQFVWYKKNLNHKESQQLTLLEPNQDDAIEIHNERLTLLKPNYQSVGDYICRALDDEKEFETIQVRAAPYVEDFGVETSHTGKSATLNDGERLELTCRVRDQTVPVNITWLMSNSPDSEYSLVAVPEYDPGQMPSLPSQQMSASAADVLVPTYTMPNNVMVERIDGFNKRLIIHQLGPEHRGYYTCLVDNTVTERTRKTIYIRVKDKILPLWPFLGILAELFILFTIIYVWETQKAQKSINTNPKGGALGAANTPLRGSVPPALGSTGGGKRPASGPSNAFESVPLNG